jgi:hypothetical protein
MSKGSALYCINCNEMIDGRGNTKETSHTRGEVTVIIKLLPFKNKILISDPFRPPFCSHLPQQQAMERYSIMA